MEAGIEGGCLCGGVRYRLRREPVNVCDCHCLDCRHASGAAFVTWGSVPKDKFEIAAGELRKVAYAGRLRSFAACCGTPLFFQTDETSDEIDVTIASLDHPESYPPEVAIWSEDRLPWSLLDPARPIYRQGRGVPG
jgi:hypothetical protein